ncbi:MAG: serpin family protein [Candidatus Paceibacterota bacterium]|jgi:serpin B
MDKKIFGTVAAVLLVAALCGCLIYSYSADKQKPIPELLPGEPEASATTSLAVIPSVLDDVGATPQGKGKVSASNNKFAFDLYSRLKGQDGNLFFSPFSISSALAMVYEGARGKTAEEILSVLDLPADSSERGAAFASIYNQLNAKDAPYKLGVANALWVQKDYALLSDYVDVLKNYYGAGANNLDFKTAAEQSRGVINKWVEERTNNKITDLLPQGSVDGSTRVVLTNAIYFKGKWAEPFLKESTKEADFYTSQSNKVRAQMMNLKDSFSYAELSEENAQILEMPYEGGSLSMLVILPKDQDLGSLENSISLDKVKEWEKEMGKKEVNVYMPKFSFTKELSLKEMLQRMGIASAFMPDAADFSGMDGTKDLFVSDAVHKAFVEVNEEGTEAAAATGVIMATTAAPVGEPLVFRADHPFMFLIKDSKTDNILFVGRVADPNK